MLLQAANRRLAFGGAAATSDVRRFQDRLAHYGVYACTATSPGLTVGREEARLACLVHDFKRSTGTVVFRLVVSVWFASRPLQTVGRDG
jgi:hypothetical protein